MDNGWKAVIWNIKWAQKVWGRLGKLLRREGEDHRMKEIFYMAVT